VPTASDCPAHRQESGGVAVIIVSFFGSLGLELMRLLGRHSAT
jgi:hypothetical protein